MKQLPEGWEATPAGYSGYRDRGHQITVERLKDGLIINPYVAQGGVLPDGVILHYLESKGLLPSEPTAEYTRIWEEVLKERSRQSTKYGGNAHDDGHSVNDWVAYIAYHAGLASYKADFRKQMVRVAALAVAAIECFDRRAKKDKAREG
jgi:hypothetical protein